MHTEMSVKEMIEKELKTTNLLLLKKFKKSFIGFGGKIVLEKFTEAYCNDDDSLEKVINGIIKEAVLCGETSPYAPQEATDDAILLQWLDDYMNDEKIEYPSLCGRIAGILARGKGVEFSVNWIWSNIHYSDIDSLGGFIWWDC